MSVTRGAQLFIGIQNICWKTFPATPPPPPKENGVYQRLKHIDDFILGLLASGIRVHLHIYAYSRPNTRYLYMRSLLLNMKKGGKIFAGVLLSFKTFCCHSFKKCNYFVSVPIVVS